jgi:hypothetical protein
MLVLPIDAAMGDEAFMAIVSLSDVQARWAYSEIVDSNFQHFYDNAPMIDTLRSKRRSGESYWQLPHDERELLGSFCRRVRPNLMQYVASVAGFNEVSLSRHQLGVVQVPPNVLGTLDYGFPPFGEFMMIPASDVQDSRNIVCDPAKYRSPSDPLTIGQYNGKSVLIDGYHRAAAFWKCGVPGGSIPAYIPIAGK